MRRWPDLLRPRLLLAAPLLAAALLAGPQQARADAMAERQQAVVGKAVADYIRPAYATFRERAERLNGTVGTFCKTGAASDHPAVDAAFRDAVEAWAAVDFLRFGPAASGARLERVAFWPDPRGFVDRQLRQLLARDDLASFDAARITGQSAAVQGLPALERLVVAIDTAPLPDDLERRCLVATAAAGNVAAIAAELDAAWRSDGVTILHPGPDNPTYHSWEEAANEVLKASLTGLEQLRDLALRPALGDGPDKAKPNRFPYAKSGDTAAYLAAAVAAQAAFIARSGIAAGLPPADAWAESSVEFELRQAERTIDGLGNSPVAAIATEPALRGRLDYVTIALASVRGTMATTIAADLGLIVGFNALDGD